ncbi:hypothetical protein A0O30_19970 [Pseudomonas sp. LLC-1]|uniref:amidase n=1 Tax=Pseudomonas sp. LLC-1 TaxID=1812180 RepID=UPI000D017661|nr:amidase [Pseudomonas sp. LLC-1]PRN03055.1 hypothetical protein A0O30_19970 [Pseudomonas sp. LLC-1]
MEIWKWSATQTRERIAAGEVSCTEVITQHIARCEAINPAINAVVTRNYEQSLEQARQMDQQRRTGETLPALFGVPVTVKINVDQVGFANSDGVPAQAEHLCEQDAPVVANLRKDGAIIIGQTNTPEFSTRWFTGNPLHGATFNPWDATLTPGGSSGGAAAAVASGIGCIAHGNDMGGSLRYPAHCCGVATLRPSMGRIANGSPACDQGRPPISQLFSVQGPIARTVQDVQLAFASMSQPVALDPDWRAGRTRGKADGPLRVVFCIDPFDSGVSPTVERAVATACQALVEAGHRVEQVRPPMALEAAMLWGRLVAAESTALFVEGVQRHGSAQINEVVNGMNAYFGGSDAEQLLRDLRLRNLIRRQWSLWLQEYDALLMPVSSREAFPDNYDLGSPAQLGELLDAQRFLYLVNLLGFPAVAVPTGLEAGVPQGVQLLGAPLDDERCLHLAADIERQCGVLTPQLWSQQQSFASKSL